MKKIVTIIIIGFFLTLSATVEVSTKAPHFRVVSGSGKMLTPAMLRGKVVIGFYEHRNAMRNETLKKVLNSFSKKWAKQSRNNTYRLAVTDAREANFMTRWVWKRKLSEKSKKMGITVYGDWDGSMLKSYGFPSKESIFIIIDKKGFIRYIHTGTVPASKYPYIKKLIKKLTR